MNLVGGGWQYTNSVHSIKKIYDSVLWLSLPLRMALASFCIKASSGSIRKHGFLELSSSPLTQQGTLTCLLSESH